MIADFNHPELRLELQNPRFRICNVHPAGVSAVWDKILPSLQKFPELWNRSVDLDTLKLQLEAGGLTLWVVLEGDILAMAFITQITNYPTMRALEVVWGVGRGMDDWLQLVLSALENFAARGGLDYVDVCGRKGWERPLARYGYEYFSSRYIKRVARETTQ